jgi:hypothetical protein
VVYLRKFAAFWYDFLVGDRMEVFLGPIVALLVVWLLLRMGISDLLAGLILFASVCLVGLLSLVLVTRGRTRA